MSELIEHSQTMVTRALEPDEVEQYEAARKGPFYSVVPDPAYLTLQGPDRVDYLQRQTTNDLALLGESRSLETVLTSPTARILDVLMLIETENMAGEAVIGILPLPGRGAQTYDYFRQRIFFMDKVTLEDHSTEWSQVVLGGNGASGVLSQLGFQEALAVGGWAKSDLEGQPSTALRVRDMPGERYLIIVGASAVAAVESKLAQLGAARIEEAVYDVLRVEVGLPGAQTELTESYTPFELGLGDTVSETKGCYTGQEVLARQVTYDKVVQHLVGLRLSDHLEIGTTLTAADKKVGTLTSVVDSPRLGAIGLGVVRRPHHEAETILEIGDQAARVVGLPFGEATE